MCLEKKEKLNPGNDGKLGLVDVCGFNTFHHLDKREDLVKLVGS